MYWLYRSRKKGGDESDDEEEEEDDELELEWASSSPTSEEQPEPWEPDTQVGTLGSPEG